MDRPKGRSFFLGDSPIFTHYPNMLYRLVKMLMRSALGMFYRHSMLRNMHHIPLKGAAILISNHPSSLMDAALLGVLLKRPIHFFARGDVFMNPIVNSILKALHMHPVHHHEGGRDTLTANDASFEKAITLLHEGALVLFFPEGSSHTDYHLLSFRKGAFRIALQAVSRKPGLDIQVVPIAINYSHPTAIFSSVWVQAAEPIFVKDYLDNYNEHRAIGIRQLTRDAEKAVRDIAIDAMAGHSPQLFSCLNIWRNSEHALNISGEQQIVAEYAISKAQPKWMHHVQLPLQEYEKLLAAYHCTDEEVVAAGRKKMSKAPLLLGFPAAAIGWFLNALPLLLARMIADKKVKRTDFYSWVLVVSSALLYVLWFIGITVSAMNMLSGWQTIGILFVMVATGQYSWNYYRYYHQWRLQQNGLKLPEVLRSEMGRLRKEILEQINAHSNPLSNN